MQAPERRQAIIVLDYGSQYSRLITRRVRECQVYSELLPATTTLAQLQKEKAHLEIRGFILSGGPASVYDEHAPACDPAILASGLPILGICYGMHLLAHQLGGHVQPASGSREYGPATLEVCAEALENPALAHLFENICATPAQTEQLNQPMHTLRLPVWMSHGDSVDTLPTGFHVLASSESNPITAMANEQGIVGLQFHPEVTHTPQGKEIIANFLSHLCGCAPSWTPTSVIDEAVARIRRQVGQQRVMCGLSGGVDSAVAALLVYRAIGDQLTCIFVDNGCMRAGEREQVVETFTQHLHIPLRAVDASERFLSRLAGVIDPEMKRKIIGEEFIRVFEAEAEALASQPSEAPIEFLVQGTLYPDVIESTSHDTAATATRIKTHHNVGGLPEEMVLKLIEPLRMLFKDEVREIGAALGLPDEWVWRHPFPGPGLAIRIIGPVSQERLDILRAADTILIEEIRKAGIYKTLGQAFAVLTPVQSVGVMGDYRTYANLLAIRAVTTGDFMTADWARLPNELLARISHRIVNEVPGVNRVVYDITSKPPATIEWE